MSLLSPKAHWSATRELMSLMTRHRQLTWELTRREVSDVYAGRVLGWLWVIGHPLIQMAVYFFIFGVVLKFEIPNPDSLARPDYAVYLLSGLIPWMAFIASMTKASQTLVANSGLVKQIVFPIEVLPVRGALAAMLPLLISFLLVTTYCLVRYGLLPWTWLLLPVLVSLQLVAMVGVSLMLSAVGVFLRDIGEVIQVFGMVGVFLMPAFFPPDRVPPIFRPILYANPFSYMVWCYQDVCYFGRIEHPWAWPAFAVLSLLTFGLGYRVFRQLKPQFGNFL